MNHGSAVARQRRDVWDKADIVARFLSSVVIAVVGILITWSIQKTQIETNEAIASAQLQAARLRAQDDKRLQENQITVSLVTHLISKDPTQRRIAVIALRQSVPAGVYDSVVEVLAQNDPNLQVRTAAIRQLAKSNRAEVGKTLSSIAADKGRASEERFLASRAGEQVALTTGLDSQTYVFAASSPTQWALESGKLTGGLFTYFLIKGMEGAADSNGDGQITGDELAEYLQHQVSSVSREFGRSDQRVSYETAGLQPTGPLFGQGSRYKKVVAVVIGISDYKDSSLNLMYASKDAAAFSQTLRQVASVPANNVYVLTDLFATKSAILARLVRAAQDADSETMLVVYYAGQGLSIYNRGAAWLTFDSIPNDPKTFLFIDEVKLAISKSSARIKALFVDSTYTQSVAASR